MSAMVLSFWPQMLAAACSGLVIGWFSRVPSHPADLLGWPLWSLLAIIMGLLGATLAGLSPEATFWIDTALLLICSYVVGVLFGILSKGAFGFGLKPDAAKAPASVALDPMPPSEIAHVATVPPDPPEPDVPLTRQPEAVHQDAAQAEEPCPSEILPSLANHLDGVRSKPRSASCDVGRLFPATGDETAAEHSGIRPDKAQPSEDGQPGGLGLIWGLGGETAARLRQAGIVDVEQVAAWTADNVAWIESYLDCPGRVAREAWIAQARVIAGIRREGTGLAAAWEAMRPD